MIILSNKARDSFLMNLNTDKEPSDRMKHAARLLKEKEPNKLTKKTMKETEEGKDIKSFETVDELFEDLNEKFLKEIDNDN